jgi:hypothetical protein
MKRLIIILALMSSSACASTGLAAKQTTVNSFQAANDFLATAQTLERSYCFNNPTTESGTHCTNPIAVQLKLTDAIHVRMATFFDQAFGLFITAGPALQAWQAGNPAPSSVTQYLADITALLAAVQSLDPGAAPLVSQLQSAANSGAQIALTLGVK